MDLTNLTYEERQAAEQAVAELRKQAQGQITYFDRARNETVSGVLSRNGSILAFIAPTAEPVAPALLNGLRLAAVTNDRLIELAAKHRVISESSWRNDGTVTSRYVEEHDFKPEFTAFLDALRSL